MKDFFDLKNAIVIFGTPIPFLFIFIFFMSLLLLSLFIYLFNLFLKKNKNYNLESKKAIEKSKIDEEINTIVKNYKSKANN